MSNTGFWGAPPGTYDSVASAGVVISADFTIPNVAGNLDWSIQCSDVHGFAGWPAGGSGGQWGWRLVSGAAGNFPVYVPSSAGGHTGPVSVTGTFSVSGDLTILKNPTNQPWHWVFFNGDNRESWRSVVTYLELWPTALGPFTLGEHSRGLVMA